jgi:hypothetical protein
MTPRIDSIRNSITTTTTLLAQTRTILDDLYVLAYDRPKAALAERSSGGARDYALDTHGDPIARNRLNDLKRALDAATIAVDYACNEAIAHLNPPSEPNPRTIARTATALDVHDAHDARQRRITRGEYTPSPSPATEQPKPDIEGPDARSLSQVVRKMHLQGLRPDRSRLTPTELDAWKAATGSDVPLTKPEKQDKNLYA